MTDRRSLSDELRIVREARARLAPEPPPRVKPGPPASLRHRVAAWARGLNRDALIGTLVVAAGLIVAAGVVMLSHVEPQPVEPPPAPSGNISDVLAGIAAVDSGTLARIKQEEGFRATVYDDSEGVPTLGYGTNIGHGINEQEADLLARYRLWRDVAAFRELWPPYDAMPRGVQGALADMAYEIGPEGLDRFGATLRHLEAREWDAAADAALDSRWARTQAPNRAREVTDIIRAGR